MKARVALVASVILLAACATPAATPDFSGAYVRDHAIRFFDGSTTAPVTVQDTLDIGSTRSGRATFALELVFDNGHLCSIGAEAAEVTPTGIVHRVTDPEAGGPFALAIDVTDGVARLRVLEGVSTYFCGMRGRIATGVELRKK